MVDKELVLRLEEVLVLSFFYVNLRVKLQFLIVLFVLIIQFNLDNSTCKFSEPGKGKL